MYSGAMDTFLRAGVYGDDKIHAAPMPLFKTNATNVATWQYVLNKASVHKEAAKIPILCSGPGREHCLCGSYEETAGPA